MADRRRTRTPATAAPAAARAVGAKNTLKLLLLTALLGAFAGVVIWCFLKAVAVCTGLVWEKLPAATGQKWLLIPLCALAGLVLGLLHRGFGDYPEELTVVLERIKREKHVAYHPMLVMLACAFIPLVFGASVGPEAGLVGIVAALCYWVGDNVTFAKRHSALFSEIGEAVTLGQLFRSPLFGILAVEEPIDGETDPQPMPRPFKFALYGLSTASTFAVIGLLGSLFGKAMGGFPSFSEVPVGAKDYWMMLLYIPVGCLLCLFFEQCERWVGKAAGRVPVVLREVLCGAAIGVTGLLVPMALFSGEEQMAELMEGFGEYAPLFLIGVCLLKLVLTAFCLKFGMKGGHFFPLIFACTAMGYGLAMLLFAVPGEHVAFAAGIVTAAALGAQMKKPLAVSVLLLLCFPARVLLWIFLAAALGAFMGNRVFPALEKRRDA